MDVVPKDCPPDVYNLWEGYDIEKKKMRQRKQDISLSRFALGMSGGEEAVQDIEVDCFSISNREETEDSVGIPVEGRKWEERVLGVSLVNSWESRRTWKRPTPRGIFLKSTVWLFKDVNSFS